MSDTVPETTLTRTASATLREETADDHRRAEHSDFQQAFVHGRLSRALYVRWLEEMLQVYRELEARLWTDPWRERYAGLLDETRRRTPDLEWDLTGLVASREQSRPAAATQAFTAQLAAWASRQSLQLFGVLYVLEGSTNGSKYIARAVRQAYSLKGRDGSGFLDPYGEEQRERWAEFKRHLDGAFSPDDAPALLDGARTTYGALGAIGRELLASAAPQDQRPV